ncbi:MAG: cupin domain-containing protein [Chloroflexi bacterium]|nr:cupin domain-containing protein [Chloroflexota bacterium]
MKAFSYLDVPAEPVEGTPGVRIRWAIGQNVGAPNYVSRIIEIDPGRSTEYHTHTWEHEVVVLEGKGTVRHASGSVSIEPGSCVYVEPGEEHQFLNAGEAMLRFVCVIPYPPKA